MFGFYGHSSVLCSTPVQGRESITDSVDESFDDQSILDAISNSNRILYRHWTAILILTVLQCRYHVWLTYKWLSFIYRYHMLFHVLYNIIIYTAIQKYRNLYYKNIIAHILYNCKRELRIFIVYWPHSAVIIHCCFTMHGKLQHQFSKYAFGKTTSAVFYVKLNKLQFYQWFTEDNWPVKQGTFCSAPHAGIFTCTCTSTLPPQHSCSKFTAHE